MDFLKGGGGVAPKQWGKTFRYFWMGPLYCVLGKETFSLPVPVFNHECNELIGFNKSQLPVVYCQR